MALVECRECGKPVSDVAAQCPHCGLRLWPVERSAFGKLALWGLIGFGLLVPFIGYYSVMHYGSRELAGLYGTSQFALRNEIVSQDQAYMTLGWAAFWVVGLLVLGILVLATRPKRAP